jgi:hypothetical protein
MSLVRTVGRYRVFERIADGGMGSVHLGAYDGDDGRPRPVAIKIMHAHHARDARLRSLFLDEARTARSLRHARIVDTVDVLSDGEDLLLVMDYVHGPSLSTLRRFSPAQRLSPDIAVALICDALDGLHAAHTAVGELGEPLQVVHRDISPQNILVDAAGGAKIVDFGIALAAGRSYATQSGEVKGKFGYMPPEQARGLEVDGRADVYAAGATLFELLTGQKPFGDGAPADILSRSLFLPPPAPSTLEPTVSAALDALVLRALSKDRDARFPSAEAFACALRASLPVATRESVAAYVERHVGGFLQSRARLVDAALVDPVSPTAVESAGSQDGARPRPRRVAWFARVAGATFAAAAVVVFVMLAWPASPAGHLGSAPRASLDELRGARELPSRDAHRVSAPSSARLVTNLVGSAHSAVTPKAGKPAADSPPGVPTRATADGRVPSTRPCCIRIQGKLQRFAFSDCQDNCEPAP